MKILTRLVLPVTSAFLLTSCATGPQDTGPKPVIKSIAIVPASNPQRITFENTNVLSGFAVWTAVAHRNDTQMKENTINSATNIGESKLGDILTEKVVSNLRAAGFQVEVLQGVERPKDYPDNVDILAVPTTADAVMQLAVTYVGIHSGAMATAFNPQIAGYALMYPKGSKRPLFDGEVQFGTALSEGKPNEIKAEPKFAYKDISTIYSNASELKGFYASGTDLVATRLSEQLINTLR